MHICFESVKNKKKNCFVSVVIENGHRGQGLGKYLMFKTEEYIKT